MIPLLNFVNVLVLVRFVGATPPMGPALALTILKNPFVWSCLVGIALQILGVHLPKSMSAGFDMLGRASIGLAILLVGAGLELVAPTRQDGALVVSAALKLVVMPLLVPGFGSALGLDGVAWSVALICAAVPTASASYELARQLGGDAPLMARIITAVTVAALATMPIMLGIF